MAAIEKPWTDEQILSDDVSKKAIIEFLQENGAKAFLHKHKLLGSAKNVTKCSKKPGLVSAYNEIFEKQAFKGSEYDKEMGDLVMKTSNLSTTKTTKKEVEVAEEPKFTKVLLRKGDKVNFPKVGDMVSCYYIGKLSDGTEFDKLQPGTKKKRVQPLQFKVGKGNVIKGWDKALLEMSVGEKAEIKIEAAWAYGRAGKPPKIPPNADLVFEVDLIRID